MATKRKPASNGNRKHESEKAQNEINKKPNESKKNQKIPSIDELTDKVKEIRDKMITERNKFGVGTPAWMYCESEIRNCNLLLNNQFDEKFVKDVLALTGMEELIDLLTDILKSSDVPAGYGVEDVMDDIADELNNADVDQVFSHICLNSIDELDEFANEFKQSLKDVYDNDMGLVVCVCKKDGKHDKDPRHLLGNAMKFITCVREDGNFDDITDDYDWDESDDDPDDEIDDEYADECERDESHNQHHNCDAVYDYLSNIKGHLNSVDGSMISLKHRLFPKGPYSSATLASTADPFTKKQLKYLAKMEDRIVSEANRLAGTIIKLILNDIHGGPIPMEDIDMCLRKGPMAKDINGFETPEELDKVAKKRAKKARKEAKRKKRDKMLKKHQKKYTKHTMQVEELRSIVHETVNQALGKCQAEDDEDYDWED